MSNPASRDDSQISTPSQSGEFNDGGDESSQTQAAQYVEHPLQYTWHFWTDKDKKQIAEKTFSNYDEKITSFGNISTVELFWGCFNNMPPASQYPVPTNVQFFKKGIKPKWEDPSNQRGSEWVFNLKKSISKDDYDRLWRDLLLSLIGEILEQEDKICGVALCRRTAKDRIEVWMRDSKSTNEPFVMALKTNLMKIFDNHIQNEPEYKDHGETIQVENRAYSQQGGRYPKKH